MAANTAQTLGTALTSILKVQIQNGSLELMNQMDPAHQFVKNSVTNVKQGDGIGRDWAWKKPVHTGIAGAGYFRSMTPNTFNYPNYALDTTDTPFPNGPQQLGLVQNYPVHADAAFLGFHQYSVTLTEYLGNMFFPVNLLRANQLNALVQEVVGLNIKGFVKHKALDELRTFYTAGISGTDKSNIATITLVSGGTTSDSVATVTLQDARVQMFPVGSTIDSYTSTTLDNANLRVVKQDLVNKQLVIGTATGADFGAALATNDKLVISSGALGSNAYQSQGCAGLNDWIKSSGSIQGVDTAQLPQLLSFVDSTVQPLSEQLLNKYFGAYNDAYGPGPDVAITTTGVMNKWADSLRAGFGVSSAMVSPYQIDRKGALDVTQGFAGIRYTYGGKEVKIFASPFCPTGYFFAFKTAGGNILRLTPPRVPGMGSDSQFGNEVEFIASYDGKGSIWKNYHSNPSSTTVSTTDVVECPMSCVFNYAIQEPQGIKFTALQEDIA